MVRTRLLRSRPWLAAVGLALVGVYLLHSRAEEAPAPDVPRDPLGAATPEYQEQALDALGPAEDVAKPPAALDPVIWAAFASWSTRVVARSPNELTTTSSAMC